MNDDPFFVGLFETYCRADEYLTALAQLLGVTVQLDIKRIIAQRDDAALFFELETIAPAAAVTHVAKWHEIRNGKIAHVESAFDGRPFDAVFVGGNRA